MLHDSLLYHNLIDGDFPTSGRGSRKHDARHGACLPVLVVGIDYGVAAACGHNTHPSVSVKVVIRGRSLNLYLRPVGVQFFGKNGGYPGMNSLADFHVFRYHGHDIVESDPQKSIRREGNPVMSRWRRGRLCVAL